MQGESNHILVTSISAPVLLQIGESILDEEPHKILNRILEEFKAINTPDEHERLLRKADRKTIREDEIVEAYIERHMRLRR